MKAHLGAEKKRTKPIAWIVLVVLILTLGYCTHFITQVAYPDYMMSSRIAPLKVFIKNEIERFERASISGEKFTPLPCSGSCGDIVANYRATEAGELTFLLRGHRVEGKTVRYKPIERRPGASQGFIWDCESDLDTPARMQIPLAPWFHPCTRN